MSIKRAPRMSFTGLLRIGTATVFVMLLQCPAMAQNDTTISLRIKSFISRMVTPETQSSGKPDETTSQALGFSELVGGRVQAYELMLTTDLAFREDPKDGDHNSGQYRIWSEVRITARCANSKLIKWKIDGPTFDAGKEGFLEANSEMFEAFEAKPSSSGDAPVEKVSFHYGIRGRPNALVTPVFEIIRPRSCYWIWHEVAGDVSCSGSSLVVEPKLNGSRFPSHRLWQDNTKLIDVKQAPFDRLWKCSMTSGLVEGYSTPFQSPNRSPGSLILPPTSLSTVAK
jgi:hypothetical protein